MRNRHKEVWLTQPGGFFIPKEKGGEGSKILWNLAHAPWDDNLLWALIGYVEVLTENWTNLGPPPMPLERKALPLC